MERSGSSVLVLAENADVVRSELGDAGICYITGNLEIQRKDRALPDNAGTLDVNTDSLQIENTSVSVSPSTLSTFSPRTFTTFHCLGYFTMTHLSILIPTLTH